MQATIVASVATLATIVACICSLPAWAIDGTVLIDQNKALAGNVTPGDAPGYPVTISVPGSYKLTGNLTVATANDNAVEITASNVTLDLNGFSILGPVSCVATRDALTCSPTGGSGIGVFVRSTVGGGVTVENGHVQGMGSKGIQIATGAIVRGVTARSNGTDGIFVLGGSVYDSHAEYNGGVGILGDLIVNSYAHGNGHAGFVMEALLTHSTAVTNYGVGLECGQGTFLGNTFLGNRNGNLSGCAGENAGGNFCGSISECPP